MQTVKVMNLKMLINKKGSYLTEAVISLPIFIIAVMVMSSVILMYACIEDCNFIAANEIRRGAAEAAVVDTSIAVPYRVKKEIEEQHRQIRSARLEDSLCRGNRWDTDELIAFDYRLTLSSPNPLGIILLLKSFSSISFSKEDPLLLTSMIISSFSVQALIEM